jgi:MoxR-like ATPase
MRRLQCTPTMPGDVPVPTLQLQDAGVLADERPVFTSFCQPTNQPHRGQSALGRCERSVTIDGTTPAAGALHGDGHPDRSAPVPTVAGSQLDRLFKFQVSYPSPEQEVGAVLTHCGSAQAPDLDALGVVPIVSGAELDALRSVPATIRVEQNIAEYAVLLARATRSHEALAVGLSPRASTLLVAAARAAAGVTSSYRRYKSLFMSLARHRVTARPLPNGGVRRLGSRNLGQVPAR